MAQAGNQTPSKIKAATWLGCCGGLAPDLDVLIFSPSDPLLFLEFHRQFSHSLIFIPIGALVVATIMHRLFSKQFSFRESYFYCLLGYATHGLLDACTTYGTQLLWPFTDQRFAWNSISIIDPLFTLPILALVIVGGLRRNRWFARAGLVWAIFYLCLGLVQRDRAVAAGQELAAARGHTPIRLEAKPGFANLLLWKLVYETADNFYVDAVHMGWQAKVYPGASAKKLMVSEHFPWLDPASQQAKDIERFRWFSNNYLALDNQVPNRIIDVRYSVVPNEIDALWAIEVEPGKAANEHVNWQSLRDTSSEKTGRWWAMLRAQPVP